MPCMYSLMTLFIEQPLKPMPQAVSSQSLLSTHPFVHPLHSSASNLGSCSHLSSESRPQPLLPLAAPTLNPALSTLDPGPASLQPYKPRPGCNQPQFPSLIASTTVESLLW